MSCFLCRFIKFRRDTTPTYLPSSSSTGKYRNRTEAITLVTESTELFRLKVSRFFCTI